MKNRDNVRIYGGEDSAVWVATKGATSPTGLAVPTTGYTEAGWLGEDGVQLEQAADQKKFRAFQGGTQIKVVTNNAERTFKFTCLEETAFVLGLAYPGLSFTTTGTGAAAVAKGTVPGGIATQERKFIIDLFDSVDGYQKRYDVPVGTIDPSNSVQHKFDDMTVYEFSVSVIGDFDILSNSPSITGVTTP